MGAQFPEMFSMEFRLRKTQIEMPLRFLYFVPGLCLDQDYLVNQLAELWVAYFRVIYFPAMFIVCVELRLITRVYSTRNLDCISVGCPASGVGMWLAPG